MPPRTPPSVPGYRSRSHERTESAHGPQPRGTLGPLFDGRILLASAGGPWLSGSPDSRLSVDLLWYYLGRSTNAAKRKIYQDALDPRYDKGVLRSRHPWNQLGVNERGRLKWSEKTLACGSEVSRFCKKHLALLTVKGRNGRPDPPYMAYYSIPLPATKAGSYENIRFDKDRLAKGVSRIKRALREGKKAVRVPLIYKDFKATRYVVPQHYIGIVGFGGDTFLYIDPYPGFSTCTYAAKPSHFLGFLVYDSKAPVLRCRSCNAKVIGGP